MEYTSAEANKLLKKLNDAHQARLYEEEQCSTFLAAMGEEPESLRPEYDYTAAQEKLRELEEKIMKKEDFRYPNHAFISIRYF